jgi:hypothetical protein
MIQRSRDLITGQLTLEYLAKKTAEGWTIAAVEWVREVPDAAREPLQVAVDTENIPYGLRISADGLHLEPNPLERTVLLLILEKIVKEKRVTEIAKELNAEGMRTRTGDDWTASAVFEMFPRLIEIGPTLLKSSDWQERRSRLSHPN